MPSRSVCAFLYCNNSAVNSPHLSFHRFPQKENSTDWIIRSGNDCLYDLTLKQLWDKRVCSEHFDKSAFMYGKRLRRDALPKMWTPKDATNCNKKVSDTTTTSNPANLPPQSAKVNNLNASMMDDSIDPESIEMLDEDLEMESQNFMLNTSGINFMSEKEDISHVQCESDKNLLNQKIKQLKKQLVKANKIIETLRKTQNERRVTVNSVLEDSAKFLSPHQLLLLRMQFKQLIDEKEWTSWEKHFACSLYNASSDAYSFLLEQQRFTLPKTSLVRRWMEDMNSSEIAILSQSPYLQKGDIVVIPEKLIPNKTKHCS